jgi:site-specific DNA-methyltransferase (adenine-specific)/adenine-specific DNA-methyltransferase
MQFTQAEIRDITKLLEAGKPLPDKYRFMLFGDNREVELVWNGKTSEVCNVVLPFQTIEQIDEPRSEKELKLQRELFDQSGRQLGGWANKLIWGDNKLVLSSLKNGPLREQIEAQGGIKLIYIDPPFDVGADFSMNVEIGEETFTKEPSVLEQLAYRDTWGKGADSFITMIYERLRLMKDLLADDGSIFIHCDWRVSSYMRLTLDEIFGKDNFLNEIIWCYKDLGGGRNNDFYKRKHDTIFWYSKSANYLINEIGRGELSEETIKVYGRHFIDGKLTYRRLKEVYPKTFETRMRQGRVPENLDEVWLDSSSGKQLEDWWIDINPLRIRKREANLKEEHAYPTQKPEELIKRIVETVSRPGDLVADFFCGSGTTLAVAEKNGRKWIGSDLGKFAIHATRKRMVGVQRELKKDGKDYRAFEILNLGKYERQFYVGINEGFRPEETKKQNERRSQEFVRLILEAYRAEPVSGFQTCQGKKVQRLVSIGPVNVPVTWAFVEDVLTECRDKEITKVDILGFDFEMGLSPKIQEEARDRGIDLALKQIPQNVFDKRAVEKNQVVFYDVAYIEAKPIIKKNKLAVELVDFAVHYSQDTVDNVAEDMKNGSEQVILSGGQIIKVSKDKLGITRQEVLTKKWSDWIDYWAVDFDYESKKETIRKPKADNPKEYEEVWTGNYIFENEWQSFRTKKDRSLELKSVERECVSGRRKIAVRVVDIFGNDTMKIIEITI